MRFLFGLLIPAALLLASGELSGRRAPGFSIPDMQQQQHDVQDYHGKILVLNFWGSWCTPCRDEAPTLAVLDQQYSSRGVAFLGDDVADTPQSALAFTRSVGITYPSINDPSYAVVAQFNKVAPLNATPTTVVIDKTGHVVGMVVGQSTYGEMTTLLSDAAEGT